ncbi:FAD-binding oxidoreductase [Desulfofundulus sp.]|uniref:FAD-binding oxidoreductase n=1 Tax=Desulfofundulus sp. TaxID=2282750 RepID=UPI003C78604F
MKDLRSLLDHSRVLGDIEDLLAYANDATHRQVVPSAVVIPESVAEVAAVLRYANERRVPVVPRGAGSSLAGGATPSPGSIVLDLKRMNRIIEVDAKNLTAVVECGVVTQRFQETVESMGLFYPPDPQSMSICTMGANVATRAGGPRGVKYGTTKDYVLGVQAVLPDGTVINYGGKSVKMSSGYDLARIFTGSEGTLGVITRVMVKLLALPPCRRTMVAVFPELDPAAEAVAAIIAEGGSPSCLEMLSQGSVNCIENYIPLGLPRDVEAFLLIEVDGHPAKVEEDCALITRVCQRYGAREVRIARTEAEAERIWLARRALFPAVAHMAPNVLIEDATVPRTRVPEMVRAINLIAERNQVTIGVSGHVGDGNLHPGIMADKRNPELMERVERAMAEIAREALRLSGTLSGEHGIGTVKAPFLEWEFGPEGVALMRRIKKAFDPNGIMNPGKIWPGNGGDAVV